MTNNTSFQEDLRKDLDDGLVCFFKFLLVLAQDIFV